MNSSIQCELKGSYKFDLYSGRGAERRLVESTEWFDNDITCSGLNYPYVYSFADCFKFLSLGTGSTHANNQTGTGLRFPLTGFQVSNGYVGIGAQSGQYIGWQGYEIGGPHDETYSNAQSSSCGSKFTDQGISLYRGWTIPTGAIENGTVSNQTITITSFMVSPGSGSDITGRGAFSIADRTVTLPSGFTATIFYQLSLNFQNFKNRTFFSGKNDGNGWFYTGNAATGVNGSETGMLYEWANCSGIYRQVLPGLQMVDALGSSFIPAWGDQMEPKYRQCKKLYFYLSPDNSQFAVSDNGVAPTTESGAYNSDGLMGNYSKLATGGAYIHSDRENDWPTEPDKWYYSGQSQEESTSVVTVATPTNIRLENLISIRDYATNLDPVNYTYQTLGYVSPNLSRWPVSYATRGKNGFDSNAPDYGQRAVFSTYLRTLPNSGLNSPTGIGGTPQRSKRVSRTAYFSPINSMGTNSRYASLVLAYLSSAGEIGEMTLQPYIDFLFFDNSGRAANMPHYRLIPEIYLTNRGSGIASVRFDITGADGGRPDSINRFHTIYGFMGPGVDSDNPNTPSGLDVSHPMFTDNIQIGNSYYPSGYVFGGVIPSTSNSGSTTENEGTGWGCVYGVVADTGFYLNKMDCCLIDNQGWYGQLFSGFSGDSGVSSYPNETGETSRIFWPYSGSGLGLRITGLGYYLKGYGSYSDSANFYSNGVYQVAQDFTYTGSPLGAGDKVNVPENDVNYTKWFLGSEDVSYSNGTYSSNGLIPSSYSSSLDMTGIVMKSLLGNSGILAGLLTGEENGYIAVTGIDPTNLALSRGIGKTWSYGDITGFSWSGASSHVGWDSNVAGGVLLGYCPDGLYGSVSILNSAGGFRIVPTRWRSPSGVIRHVESWNGTGRRLLPNYAYPNNQEINYYSPVRGGSFPGLSMENGLQMFCDFIWSGG
jgi:hypothetical protein